MPSAFARHSLPGNIVWIFATATIALSGCSSQQNRSDSKGTGATGVSQPSPDEQAYLHYPNLDLRIVRFSLGDLRKTLSQPPQPKQVLYPDRWHADARALLDFRVTGKRLVALLARRAGSPVLVSVDLQSDGGRVLTQRYVASGAHRLKWDAAAHSVDQPSNERHPAQPTVFALSLSTANEMGRVDRLDATTLRGLGQVTLDGDCLDLSDNGRYAIERVEVGADQWRYAVAELDLDKGRVNRRLQLPAGASSLAQLDDRTMLVGQASSDGLHATDGTLSVVDLRRFEIIDRLRLAMSPRFLGSLRGPRPLVVVTARATTGAMWLSGIDTKRRVTFESTLDGGLPRQVALSDRAAYFMDAAQGRILHLDPATLKLSTLTFPHGPYGEQDMAGMLRINEL